MKRFLGELNICLCYLTVDVKLLFCIIISECFKKEKYVLFCVSRYYNR